MRFTSIAPVALAAVALAAVTGCGSSPPTPPDGEWVITVGGGEPPAGKSCLQGLITEMLGEVNDSAILSKVLDGQTAPNENGDTAMVSCTVTGSGMFNVQGSSQTTSGSKILEVQIPAMTKNASQSSPATGGITFSSADKTHGVTYSSSACQFYFANPSEGVDSGKVWAAFTCPDLAYVDEGSDCYATGFLAFENCGT